MSDRNEYMKEYMREYRAAKRAARLAETGDTLPAAAAVSTEPGQLAEIPTEPGVYARYKWAWWLLAGVVVGFGFYLWTARSKPIPGRPALAAVFKEESTEPVNTEGQADNTEWTDEEVKDHTAWLLQENTTEGQADTTEGQE